MAERNTNVPTGSGDLRKRANCASHRDAMSESPLSRIVTIVNRRGLHARASARFVRRAAEFDAEVTVTRDGQTVPGTSIMGLLALGAGPGSQVEIAAEGSDAQEAIDALSALVADRFGEE